MHVVQAGGVPTDTAALATELQKTWSREAAMQWDEAYATSFPPYKLLIQSYM